MKVTLKDVAKEAGCSFMAVSRVINKKQLNHVSPKLQKRIREAVEKLNYQSNPVARALRTGRTHTIGLMVGRISGRTQACTAHALLNEFKKYGYQLNIALTNYNKAEEEKALEELVNRHNDGIILNSLSLAYDSEIYQKLVALKIPLLLSEDPGHSFNTVCINIREALSEAFRLFRAHGHSKVAIISSASHFQHNNFKEIAEECGVDLAIFSHLPLRSSMRKSFEDYLAQDIPAVMSIANGVIQKLLQFLHGINSEFRPSYIYPYTLPFDYIEDSSQCLGAISVPFKEKIETLAARIVKIIENPDEPRLDTEIPCHIISNDDARKLYFKQTKDPYFDVF